MKSVRIAGASVVVVILSAFAACTSDIGSEPGGTTLDGGSTVTPPTTGLVGDAQGIDPQEGGDAAGACPGLGTFCGSRIGLDATKLYHCNESKVQGVAEVCTGKCIVVPGADADLCPCPDGDGRYCGDRVGGEATKLYDCKAGVIKEATVCAPKCTSGAGPTADRCAACPSGDGQYCGVTVGADKNKLYTCAGGALSVKADCGGACVVKPAGTADACPACPSGDGKYCGGSVGLDPNTLYDCKTGVFTTAEKCGTTCFIAPAGTADYCTTSGAGLVCGNIQWWNSAITYGPYIDYGWWDTDLGVSNMSKVELRHASRLDKEGVYAWGWMPEFTDTTTNKKFRFLHLQPSAKYTTSIGTVYPAGTIVGLSGGGTTETGYPVYSTAPHLCVQTVEAYRAVFPAGVDACK